LSTAPARKKIRNTAKFQPALSAHHNAPEPIANSTMAIVHTNSWGWRRFSQRSAVDRAKALAMSAAPPARAELVALMLSAAAKTMGAG